jgi:RNA polymerase sigma factor (sigma-70 family)
VPTHEATLLARYAAVQDPEAFRELFEAHQHMVFAACNRILQNRADAEDASQNCFLLLARKAAHLRAPVAGWLHTVAVQAAIDLLRRKRVRQAREREAREEQARTEQEESWQLVKGDVDAAITLLPEELRAPLVMYYLEGRKQEEIAEELGVSQPTVSTRIQKGVTTLRRQLERRGSLEAGVALGPLLTAYAMEPAPAALGVALGKMALAGVSGTLAPAGSAGVGVGLKLLLAVCGMVGVLFVGVFALMRLVPDVGLSGAAWLSPVGASPPVEADMAEEEDTLGSPGGTRANTSIGSVLNEDGSDVFLDLDTGVEMTGPPETVTLAEFVEWMRESGADILYHKELDLNGVLAADMAVVQVPVAWWDAADPATAEAAVAAAPRQEVVRLPLAAQRRRPATHAFKTREGTVGLLQLLGFTDARKVSLELRYRAATEDPAMGRLTWRLADAGM